MLLGSGLKRARPITYAIGRIQPLASLKSVFVEYPLYALSDRSLVGFLSMARSGSNHLNQLGGVAVLLW